MNKQIRILIIS